MAIITISQQLGAGGPVVAEAAAGALGYRVVGSGMLAQAAEAHELTVERLRKLGRAKPGLRDRFDGETQLYLAVIRSAVYEAAAQDDVVLLGRAGQWLLRAVPHALRVRLVAPFETRVGRLGEQGEIRATRAAISDFVRRDDTDRAGRMRFLYDRDVDDPQLYDLVVNTDRGDFEGTAATLVALARRPGLATTDPGRRILADLALAARARVALMSHEDTRDERHDTVEAQEGRVHVVTAGSPTTVAQVVRAVEGVVEVTTEEIPALPPMPMM